MSSKVDLLVREAEKKFHLDKPLPEIVGSPNLLFHAKYVCALANTIIEMFESGQLKFSNVEIEEDEEE